MGLPNCFILGAGRCGTTRLSQLLARVDGVCMPALKEPNYFALKDAIGFYPHGPGTRSMREQRLSRLCTRTRTAYEALYDNATTRVDGSVCYLWNSEVPARVAKEIEDPRFVIMMRDPVERAFSQHLLTTTFGMESIAFLPALKAEPERTKRGWGFDWQYAAGSDYATCFARWCEHHSRERFLLLTFQDLIDNPILTFSRVLKHFGVDETLAKAAVEHIPKHPNDESPMSRSGVRLKPLYRAGLALRHALRPVVPRTITAPIGRRFKSLLMTRDRPMLSEDERRCATEIMGKIPETAGEMIAQARAETARLSPSQ